MNRSDANTAVELIELTLPLTIHGMATLDGRSWMCLARHNGISLWARLQEPSSYAQQHDILNPSVQFIHSMTNLEIGQRRTFRGILYEFSTQRVSLTSCEKILLETSR